MCLRNAGRIKSISLIIMKKLNKKSERGYMKIYNVYGHKRAKKSYVNAAGPRNKEGLGEYESVKMSSANSMQKDERFIMQKHAWLVPYQLVSLSLSMWFYFTRNLLTFFWLVFDVVIRRFTFTFISSCTQHRAWKNHELQVVSFIYIYIFVLSFCSN